MAGSWKEAQECARKEGKEQVYHDFDTDTYGVCSRSERQGHFDCGQFVEHRCICMPASLSAEELAQKENAFLDKNPDWLSG